MSRQGVESYAKHGMNAVIFPQIFVYDQTDVDV